VRPDGALGELAAEAQAADLVVVPHRHERSLTAFLLGQPVMRLLRRCRTPVLVVRDGPALDASRILVAVDFTSSAHRLVEVAAALDPGAQLQVFHAVDMLGEGHLRAADVSVKAISLYRAQRRREADRRLQEIVGTMPARPRGVRTTVGRGTPGRQIVLQQEHSLAGLVVVGKRRASAWAEVLLGSVAQDVLRRAHGDVLVVPDGADVAARARREPLHDAGRLRQA
jgi:nucleotide-binding universal stress UspA family protein